MTDAPETPRMGMPQVHCVYQHEPRCSDSTACTRQDCPMKFAPETPHESEGRKPLTANELYTLQYAVEKALESDAAANAREDAATIQLSTERVSCVFMARLLENIATLTRSLAEAEQRIATLAHLHGDIAFNSAAWQIRAEKAKANQRTPGMVEVCSHCRGQEPRFYKSCQHPMCPIKSAAGAK